MKYQLCHFKISQGRKTQISYSHIHTKPSSTFYVIVINIKNVMKKKIHFLNDFNYLLILEAERDSVGGGGDSQADSILRVEPDTGLDPTTLR